MAFIPKIRVQLHPDDTEHQISVRDLARLMLATHIYPGCVQVGDGIDVDDNGIISIGSLYASPAFTSFLIVGQATTIEVGATIAAGSKTFTWTTSNSANVAADSISITDTTASTVLASGLANDGTEDIVITDITLTDAGDQVWTIDGVNTNAIGFSRTFTVSWEWKVYAGISASVVLDETEIKALSDFNGLQSGFAGTYNYSATGYKYFAYPDEMGDVAVFRDPSTGFLIAMAQVTDNAAYSNIANGYYYALVSVTNANGITTDYRLYRSQNVLGGTISFAIS